ncbi:MAG: TonB family protein [candidate division Zixibacteria bacterium]|nr:TonB family protein [candidate division Zixibacteria bacterium]
MGSPFSRLINRIETGFERMDAHDAIPHPIKRFSRRFLAVSVGLAALVHMSVGGGWLLYRLLTVKPSETLTLIPYPSELMNPVITAEEGGGGGGEPPPAIEEDVINRVIPVSVSLSVPEPVPDVEMLGEQEIAEPEVKDVAMVSETPSAPAGGGQTGTGSGGLGGGGFGGGPGAEGGSGGDGPPGAWKYDTPPNPRRLPQLVQPKKLRNIAAIVKFRLLINEFGLVIDATISESSGYKELDDLALEAINKSVFNPATFQGRPVKAWIAFGYGFRSKS